MSWYNDAWEWTKDKLPLVDSDQEQMDKMAQRWNSGERGVDMNDRHVSIPFGTNGAPVGGPSQYSSAPNMPGQQFTSAPAAGLFGSNALYGSDDLSSMGSAAKGLMQESATEPLFKKNEAPSGGGGGFFGDMSGAEKAAMILSGVGTLGGIYGQYKEGQARDEQIKREREDYERRLRERDASAKRLSPILAGLLGRNKQSTQMESRG